jgi:hypothetical protein
VRPDDTSQVAHDFQVRGYRRTDAAQKAAIVAELSGAVRDVAREGIRQRHPGYGDDDVKKALVVLLYGPETARLLWPGEEPRDP